MTLDPLGDRIKAYEELETSRKCELGMPIIARLDGRAFHTFTKDLTKPFDVNLTSAMIQVTRTLVSEARPLIGYTQSDEITLVFYYEGESQPIFGGKIHKLTSILASIAGASFAQLMPKLFQNKRGLAPSFDCRIFQVPTKEEAANCLLWRWFDARRNSISALAQANFSHAILQGKTTDDMLNMLIMKQIDWNSLPNVHKWGTFIRREVKEVLLDKEVLERIPQAKRPNHPVMRASIEVLSMPPFDKVKNRNGVIFNKEMPLETSA